MLFLLASDSLYYHWYGTHYAVSLSLVQVIAPVANLDAMVPPAIDAAVGTPIDTTTIFHNVPLRDDNFRLRSLKNVWHVPGAAEHHGCSGRPCKSSDGKVINSNGSRGAFFVLTDNPTVVRVLRVRLIGPVVMALKLERTPVLPDTLVNSLGADIKQQLFGDSPASVRGRGAYLFVARYYLPSPGIYDLSIIATYRDAEFQEAISDLEKMMALCAIRAFDNEQVLTSFDVQCGHPSGDAPRHGTLNLCGVQEPFLSPFMPKIFWRVDPELEGFIYAASAGTQKRPVAHHAFADGRFMNRSCCQEHLAAWANPKPLKRPHAGDICFLGDSHVRYLYNDVVLSLLGGVDANIELRHQARQEPHFKFLDIHFAPDIDKLLATVERNCSVVFANFGQWLLGWPEDRPWTVAEYARDVDDVLRKVKAALTSVDRNVSAPPSKHSLYWLLQEGCPEANVFYCPPGDWRSDAWTRAYNDEAMRVAKAHGVPILDMYSIYEAVQELTLDGCHYTSPLAGAAVETILGELWPGCILSACEIDE